VKAVTSVASVWPIVSRVRWVNAVMSVAALVTAPKTWRPPATVSTLPSTNMLERLNEEIKRRTHVGSEGPSVRKRTVRNVNTRPIKG